MIKGNYFLKDEITTKEYVLKVLNINLNILSKCLKPMHIMLFRYFFSFFAFSNINPRFYYLNINHTL